MIPDILKDLQQSELCGNESELTQTTLRYEFDRVTITVEGVPAVVCHATQETLVYGPLATAIGDAVHKLAESARIIEEQTPGSGEPLETTVRFGSGAFSLA